MKYFRGGLELEISNPAKISKTRGGHVVEKYETTDNKTGFFVTLKGTHYCAHGETLAQAISDALWKDETKRPSLDALKSEIREAGKDRPITLNEFRLLTGACSEGCRLALDRKGLDGSPMKAHDIFKHFSDWGKKLLDILEWSKNVKE